MKNKIIYIKRTDLWEIKRNIFSDSNIFWVEIDGKNCLNLSDYLIDISTKFQFPTMAKGLDGYDDWLTDLTWIDKDSIVVIINNYIDFLKSDILSKENVMELFEISILPWWEAEVCDYVVDGKPKSFLVYLVD